MPSRVFLVLVCCLFLPAVAGAQDETVEQVFNVWGAGFAELSPAESEFLVTLASERFNAPGRRGGTERPGQESEIVRQAILYDLIEAVGADNDQIDPNMRALIAQASERFYYFETGVTIVKGRWETIDAVIFELTYEPDDRVSTYSQLPDHTSRAILTLGVETELALTGELKVKPKKFTTPAASGAIGVEVSGGLSAALERKFDLKEILVDAVGEKQPWARWSINSGDLIQDDVRFIAILRIPSEVQQITISARAIFIDKFFGLLESSRQEKALSYACTLGPPSCRSSS